MTHTGLLSGHRFASKLKEDMLYQPPGCPGAYARARRQLADQQIHLATKAASQNPKQLQGGQFSEHKHQSCTPALTSSQSSRMGGRVSGKHSSRLQPLEEDRCFTGEEHLS